MKKKRRSPLVSTLSKIASLLITLVIIGGFGYLYISVDLPDVSALKSAQLQVPLKIYSKDGQLLGEFGEMQRTPLTLDQIPTQLINAVLATEDQRFYEHGGIDLLGLIRAATELLLTGTKSQGGSTITMQVARNFYLSRQKTFSRKLDEVLLAMKIDSELSKEKVLELYLNKIYLGKRAYGVAAAAEVYYGKPLDQLSLPELAMIAGLPKAPSTINPVTNPDAARKRRDHVLERMYTLGYIDKEAYEAAVAAPNTASYHGQPIKVKASYVAEMVRNLMLTSFGSKSYTEGYKVYTTLDNKLQVVANHAMREAILAYDQRHGYRGPETNLGKYTADKMLDWEDTLEGISSVNGLKAGAVIQINNDTNSIVALLADGNTITIPWSGMKWTNRSSASSVAKIGDVIRIQTLPNHAGHQLAQVPDVDGALVALNPSSGAIIALVGGFDYRSSNFNRVAQALRQPGSSFKPFIYSAALDKGFTLASIVNDAPLVYVNPGNHMVWRPQNDDHEFWGPVRLREALAHSRNLVSVRLLQSVGVHYAVDYLKRFGFDPQKLPAELSLALGSASLSPLDMVTGYAVFANGGFQVTPYLIEKVETIKGKTIYEAHPKLACDENDPKEVLDHRISLLLSSEKIPCASRAISAETAFLMTSAMQEVIRTGTGRAALVLERKDLAGKTGTSNDMNDAWFSGFNSDVVATAWMGFDQPDSLHEHGAQAALPMWIAFMREALAGKPEHTMIQPPGITTAHIDPRNGLLAQSDEDSGAVFEYFKAGTEPTEMSNGVPAEALDSDSGSDTDSDANAADNPDGKADSSNTPETTAKAGGGDPLF